jgi:hypothetical protein
VIDLLADLNPKTFWNAPNDSTELKIKIAIALLLGVGMLVGLLAAPPRLRRPIVGFFTFISGLYYFLLFVYPQPIGRNPEDVPRNTIESISFWISDAQPVIANFSNIISGFLLGLGVFSLLRIHLRKVARQQRDWPFSAVLLVSLVLMVFFGYWDWISRSTPAGSSLPFVPSAAWSLPQYGNDLLFNGLLQQMDATMFSLIAFYILSAAYRAFRARSVEATVLLLTAFVVMLSFMGAAQGAWDGLIGHLAGGNQNAPIQNLRLTAVYLWLRDTMQTPSIRGIDFGVGIGLLAMSLRLWLSLEKLESEA